MEPSLWFYAAHQSEAHKLSNPMHLKWKAYAYKRSESVQNKHLNTLKNYA